MFKLEGRGIAEDSVLNQKTLKAVLSLPQLNGYLSEPLPREYPLGSGLGLASIQVEVVYEIENMGYHPL